MFCALTRRATTDCQLQAANSRGKAAINCALMKLILHESIGSQIEQVNNRNATAAYALYTVYLWSRCLDWFLKGSLYEHKGHVLR